MIKCMLNHKVHSTNWTLIWDQLFFCRAYVVNCEDDTTAHSPSSLPYTVLDATDLIAKDANGEDSLPLVDCAL